MINWNKLWFLCLVSGTAMLFQKVGDVYGKGLPFYALLIILGSYYAFFDYMFEIKNKVQK